MEDLENRICFCERRIKLSNGDLIKCSKKEGQNLSHPIPFLEDKEVCIGVIFNEKSEHVIPERKIDVCRMYKCPYREYKK
ncbi:Uncharacterised protein [uncultured archaeon]|nr:Uncharacterised protein [uncultured archaeon]